MREAASGAAVTDLSYLSYLSGGGGGGGKRATLRLARKE
jgi:hypothetical protein